MSHLNKDVIKALQYIEKLRAVVEKKDLKGIYLTDELANEIDFVNVRPAILKRIDKLYNHPNYSDQD